MAKKKAGKKAVKKKDKAAKKPDRKKSSGKRASGRKDDFGKAGKNKSGTKKSSEPVKPTKKAGSPAADGSSRHGPSVKDSEMYEALRGQGASEQKAARISNAAAATSRAAVGRKGGRAEDYADRTKAELLQRARELEITGRSSMNKAELIDALRNN